MKTSVLFLLGAVTAFAAPRDWTAADGRVINAEYLGRAPDGSALVLERSDTKARVTVPLAALSADDQAFAGTLPTTIFEVAPSAAPPEKKGPSPELVALSGKWPSLASNHAVAQEIKRRYEPNLESILSGNVAQNCRTLRLRIERDLPIIKNEAAITITSDDHYTEKGRTKIAKVRAAESCMAWLRSIDSHAGKIQAEAEKSDAVVTK